jgi:hypothetical protein
MTTAGLRRDRPFRACAMLSRARSCLLAKKCADADSADSPTGQGYRIWTREGSSTPTPVCSANHLSPARRGRGTQAGTAPTLRPRLSSPPSSGGEVPSEARRSGGRRPHIRFPCVHGRPKDGRDRRLAPARDHAKHGGGGARSLVPTAIAGEGERAPRAAGRSSPRRGEDGEGKARDG